MTHVDKKIKEALRRALLLLGADRTLLAILGSWGATRPDAEVLSEIERWTQDKARETTGLVHQALLTPEPISNSAAASSFDPAEARVGLW